MRSKDAPFNAYDYKKEKEPYLFISYAHADSARVFPYIKRLHDDGFRIWYDEGIPYSQDWDEEVAAAIDSAAIMVLFVSPISVTRLNVKRELVYATDSDKRVMALYLEETTLPRAWKLRLGASQAVHDIDASYVKVKHDLPQSTRVRSAQPVPQQSTLTPMTQTLVAACAPPYG